jgi:hypothetical protein
MLYVFFWVIPRRLNFISQARNRENYKKLLQTQKQHNSSREQSAENFEE